MDSRQYIDKLRNDPGAYRNAFRKEGEIWGRVLTSPQKKQRLAEDREAALKLNLNRGKLGLMGALPRVAKRPRDGLSLACGEGRAERDILQKGICDSFHGVDVSDNAIIQARELAEAGQLPITYEVADLNNCSLRRDAYDLVVTQNCLHHVLELEHLADQIWHGLRDDGLLWIHDYIGESQFQYDDKRLEVANRVLSTLPPGFIVDNVHGRDLSSWERRPVGKLASPFEAIRSAEIMPIFLRYFEVIEKSEGNAILHLVCPVGTRANWDRDEGGRAAFEILMELEQQLLQNKVLPPTEGRYLLRKKPRPD